MKLIVRLFIIFMIISCCFALVMLRDFLPWQTSIYLATWELKLAGYYTYILPQEDQKEFNWNREIYIYRLGCAQGASSAGYNPIRASYEDNSGEWKLNISVSPNNPFGRTDSTDYIQLDIESNWISNHEAEVYLTEDDIPVIAFKDIFDMNVTVAGNVPQDKLIDLVTRLEYLGPNPDSIDSPWAEACE